MRLISLVCRAIQATDRDACADPNLNILSKTHTMIARRNVLKFATAVVAANALPALAKRPLRPPPPPAVSGNLVFNPGFESGAFSPWTTYGYCYISKVSPLSGAISALIRPNSGVVQTLSGLKTNTDYVLKARARANSGDGIWIGAKNFGGTEQYALVNSTTVTSVSMMFRTGASNTSAQIYGWGNTVGDSTVDDFEVLQVSTDPPPPLTGQPVCGVTGYTLNTEYTFGTNGSVKNLSDLTALFTHDAPWGRINGELQSFQPFNSVNHVFEADCLALTGLHDGTKNYTDYGHITSGAMITRATFKAPCVIEVICKLPAGRAVWPSIWCYTARTGQNDDSEIDIMESQFNAPVGQRDDRSGVYQNDRGVNCGVSQISNPGGLDQWGRWRPYGPMPGGDMSARYAAYSAHWQTDRVTKYVDNKPGVVRLFRWGNATEPNLLVYNSIGSSQIDWPGPVLPETFTGDNAKFRVKAIRVFKPVP